MGTKRTSRKKQFNLPVHLRKVRVVAKVAKELAEKIGKKRDVVKKGDVIRVLRGDFKTKEGKVIEVDRKEGRLYVDTLVRKNSRGQDVHVPVHASNVMIIKRGE
jgi:large subunit ribosomal protein L24